MVAHLRGDAVLDVLAVVDIGIYRRRMGEERQWI